MRTEDFLAICSAIAGYDIDTDLGTIIRRGGTSPTTTNHGKSEGGSRLTPSAGPCGDCSPIHQEAIHLRAGWSLNNNYSVSAHADGSPLDPTAVTRTFSTVVRRAGSPHVCLHHLRHAHATLMQEAGVHPKIEDSLRAAWSRQCEDNVRYPRKNELAPTHITEPVSRSL